MVNNNARFLTAYNRLDNYLQTLVKVSRRVNMISYLEKILPEKQRAEIKTVREYKNTIESHGVNPGNTKPIVPETWIAFLSEELAWCKKNSRTIAPKLQQLLDAKKSDFTVRKAPIHNNPTFHHSSARSMEKYVIYILTPRGRSLYFVRFYTDCTRYGFLKLKKEYSKEVESTSNIEKAAAYPTKEDAEFIAKEVRKIRTSCRVSVRPYSSCY